MAKRCHGSKAHLMESQCKRYRFAVFYISECESKVKKTKIVIIKDRIREKKEVG